MNNPLAQQAQYYLNESSRLSEELNTEIEYSAVLEAVLEELVGTEDFLKIMEVYLNPGSIDQTASGGIRSDKPGRNNRANVTKRIGQLGKIAIARQKETPGNEKGLASSERRDREQGVTDAMLAFRTHGGQVTRDGNLLPSSSNDNATDIMMTDAKKKGVPIHVDAAANGTDSDKSGLSVRSASGENRDANQARVDRKGWATRRALQRPMPGNDEGEETKGQYAIRTNAEAAKKKRMAAGKDAAARSGMITMQDHYDLVQGIMNLLTSNRNENDLSEGQARSSTNR